MTSNSNIIQFPGKNKAVYNTAFEPTTKKQIKDSTLAIKLNHVDEVLDVVTTQLIDNILISGFGSIVEAENAKDIGLLYESIRSLLNKHYKVKHPLQKLSEKAFEIKPDIPDTVFFRPEKIK